MEELNEVVVKGKDNILTIPMAREFVVVVVVVIVSGFKGSRDCSEGSNSEGKKSNQKNSDLHDELMS